MNTAKEKKLKAIKSEILKITDFLRLNNNDENFDTYEDVKIENDSNDTLVLTNVINREPNSLTDNDLTNIKNELYTLKLLLKKNEMMLKEILLKIK